MIRNDILKIGVLTFILKMVIFPEIPTVLILLIFAFAIIFSLGEWVGEAIPVQDAGERKKETAIKRSVENAEIKNSETGFSEPAERIREV